MEKEDYEETLKSFEELTKRHDVYFAQDNADGFFIKIKGKGSLDFYQLAELGLNFNGSIIEAMQEAIKFMRVNS